MTSVLFCPNCKWQAGIITNFGKRAFCRNCRHGWYLRWRGGKTFSSAVRQEYV